MLNNDKAVYCIKTLAYKMITIYVFSPCKGSSVKNPAKRLFKNFNIIAFKYFLTYYKSYLNV